MKKTTLTINELQEFNYKENWCLETAKYLDKVSPIAKNISWFANWPKMSFTKKWLNGLRMAYNDSLEMVQDLDPNQYKKLDEILRKKFGHGLFEADQKHIKRVTKIVEKGKISNKEQYYLLREYFERIWDMPEYKETAKKIEDILFTFEKIKI